MIDERIKKRIELTESSIIGELNEVLAVIKKERRSGHLIISFAFGNEMSKKFELMQPIKAIN